MFLVVFRNDLVSLVQDHSRCVIPIYIIYVNSNSSNVYNYQCFRFVHLERSTKDKRREIAITKYLHISKIATNFRPRPFPSLNPSAKSKTSAMSSLFGDDIMTGLKSCFRLSGSFCLPPYPFPAGFSVMKIPELASRSIYKKNIKRHSKGII